MSLSKDRPITIPDTLLPIVCADSEFFPIADQILDLEKKHPKGLYNLIASSTTIDHPVFPSQHNYQHIHEPNQPTSNARMLKLTLDLSSLLPPESRQVEPPTIFIVSTAAHHALTVGRFIVDENSHVVFQLPRFSIEPTIQTDMSTAINQVFHIPEITDRVIGDLDHPVQEAYLTYLTREGHLTDVQQAVFHTSGHHIPYTIANIQHLKKEDLQNQGHQFHSIFNRICLINPVNLEGLNPSQIKTLILGDQVASGMQIVDLADYIIQKVASQDNNHHIDHLVTVAPLSSLFGIFTISLWAAAKGIKTTFIASSSLLDSGPNKYYSPLSQNGKVAPIPTIQTVHSLAHPENVRGQMCVGCNWTARFGASPETALNDSETEAEEKGTTNQQLKKHAAQQTKAILKMLEANNLPRTILIPESSRIKASAEGKLGVLEQFIDKDPATNQVLT